MVEWIGYALDVGRFEMGVTAQRIDLVITWLVDKVAEVKVQLGELREGLGRIQFVAGPLEHLRPFLGPWTHGRQRDLDMLVLASPR